MFNRKKILVFYFFIFIFSLILFLVTTEESNKYAISLKISSAYKYFYSGRLEKAKAICDDVLSKEPHNYKVLELTGKIYLAMGEKKKAISYFRQARVYAPKNARISIFLEKLE